MRPIYRQPGRRTSRATLRRPFRHTLRRCLRGRGGPSDLTQMLTAYGKAIRAHRQLARLAPSFFDAAVVNRERENREEKRKWMAMWEPAIAKAYGVPSKPTDLTADLPRLPHPGTQRAVERRLAEVQLWLEAGRLARERHQQRRPHAIPSLSQLARLLQLAFDLKKMVLGLDSQNPLPDKITYDYEFTDLKRAYGQWPEPAPSVAPVRADEPTASAGATPPSAHSGLPSQPSGLSLPAPPPPRCDAYSRLTRQLWARKS